jgi:hypothetical protein
MSAHRATPHTCGALASDSQLVLCVARNGFSIDAAYGIPCTGKCAVGVINRKSAPIIFTKLASDAATLRAFSMQ